MPHKSLIKQTEKNKLKRIHKLIIVTFYLKTHKALFIIKKFIDVIQIKTGMTLLAREVREKR